MIHPLSPTNEEHDKDAEKPDGFVVRNHKARTVQPIAKHSHYANPAAEIIRQKLDTLYQEEPSAEEELANRFQTPTHRSKHQQMMYDLSISGKPLAQIHTEWHNYYQSLPDTEKHQVWNEFYEANAKQYSAYQQHSQPFVTVGPKPLDVPVYRPNLFERSLPNLPHSDRTAVKHIKQQLSQRIISNNERQSKAKQHLHSLAFGLSTGFLVLFILLFGLFNEVVIAPFIQPSRHVSATPIIVSTDSLASTTTPEVIIPKINVEIPVVYGINTTDENTIETDLEQGVIHYATTSVPGEKGNTALFGHSSNNIFNKGKYKFAFVLLHKLVPGDIFYLTYNKTIYTYRVFDKRIVAPNEVSVLNDVPGKVATAALITCDPPGTSNNRLVVWGEQISPDPSQTATPEPAPSSTAAPTPTTLPSEGPSLLSRILHWDF